MASNSDSIVNVLAYLYLHKEDIRSLNTRYDNVIQLFFKDTVKVFDADVYFPDNKLIVNRMSDEFCTKNGNLLEKFWALAGNETISYHEVWITTAHLTERHVYLLEISFE